MSKAKVLVDRFFANGAIFEAAPSHLAFAAALAMVASTTIAPPAAAAERGTASLRGSDFSYSAFIADLQARLDRDLGAGKTIVVDRSASSASQFERLRALGVEGVHAHMGITSNDPSTQLVGSDNGPVCIVAGPGPTTTAEDTFEMKGGDVIQLGSITDLDVQKWGTYAQVGQCFHFNSPRQGAVFAAYMTHLDESVSRDLLPVTIAFNELNEWSGIHSATNDFVSSSLRRAEKTLGNDLFLTDLDRASIVEVADFASKTYSNASSWRADTFRTSLQSANVVGSPDSISAGFDTDWLDQARVIPEVEQIRDLREFLIGHPATRVLPVELEVDEFATKLFTRVLVEQGDRAALRIAAGFNFEVNAPAVGVIQHPVTEEALASAFGFEDEEVEAYSAPAP